MRGESETGRSVKVTAFLAVPIPGKNEKLQKIILHKTHHSNDVIGCSCAFSKSLEMKLK